MKTNTTQRFVEELAAGHFGLWLWLGIAVSGGAYGGTVLFAGGFEAVLIGLVYGFLFAGVAAGLIIPIAAAIRWTLNASVSWNWIGAFTGGLAGGACATAMWIGPYQFNVSTWLLGPGLATIFGQIGGALGGRATDRAFNKSQSQSPEEVLELRPMFRFRIGSLLGFITWLAVLLAVVSRFDFPAEWVVSMTVIWPPFQAVTLLVGWTIFTCLTTGILASPRSTWNNPHLPQ